MTHTMAAADAPTIPSGPRPGEAGVKAHIKQSVKGIEAVLGQDAPSTEVLISQANVHPDERGWLVAMRTWQNVCPQQSESYMELSKQLLGATAASAGGIKSTTLIMCAQDTFATSNYAIGLRVAPKQDSKHTIEELGLDLLVARGCLMVEGYVRIEDPHLTAQHIVAGIEEALGRCSLDLM